MTPRTESFATAGHDIIFETEAEALKAANAEFLKYLNSPITGISSMGGSKKSVAKKAAEKLFRGGGKTVEVERKRLRHEHLHQTHQRPEDRCRNHGETLEQRAIRRADCGWHRNIPVRCLRSYPSPQGFVRAART
ncbi:hypothetical protein AJ87_26345 [Rhizobium yanglingense]|nr:hypothetical protein AJ87_26345 [Rhizobium yanglingense]